MTAIRQRLSDERGFVLPVTLVVLLVLLLLTAAVVSATVSESSGGRRDTAEKRAFESAQTGLQVSLYRMNMLINADATHTPDTLLGMCTGADSTGSGYIIESPSASYNGTYCAPFTESLGNGSFYTSWISKAFLGSSGTCAGVSVGTNSQVTERCVVSQGIVCPPSYSSPSQLPCPGQVVHRVEERVAAFTGKPVFPLSGVFGLNGVLIKNSAQLLSLTGGPVVATNKQLALQNSATATGPVLEPRSGQNPIIQNTALLGSSPQCDKNAQAPFPTNCEQFNPGGAFVASPVQPPPVTMDNAVPANYLTPDGDVRIDNAFKPSCLSQTGCSHDTFQGCNSASSCGWDRTNHTLSLPNGVTWNLGGAQYNFCSLSMQGQSTALLSAATGANGQQLKSAIYIDSPSDPGSGCPSGTGYLNVTNQASITNNAPPLPGSPLQHDTTAFELWVYGPSSDVSDGSATYNHNHCITPVQPDCVQLGNRGNFYGTLYAPNSDVLVNNQGNNYGGVMGGTVTYDNPGTFTQDVNVPTLVTTATLAIYYRTAWGDCAAQPSSSSNPASGC